MTQIILVTVAVILAFAAGRFTAPVPEPERFTMNTLGYIGCLNYSLVVQNMMLSPWDDRPHRGKPDVEFVAYGKHPCEDNYDREF